MQTKQTRIVNKLADCKYSTTKITDIKDNAVNILDNMLIFNPFSKSSIYLFKSI